MRAPSFFSRKTSVAHDTRRRRVAAEVHRLLNELLRTEVKDPRLEDVTVSEVEMSGDLGVARIYYTTLDPDAPTDDVELGFQKASGFIRGRVGHALRLRRAPELQFIRDESARRGAELTRLIDSLVPEGHDLEAQGEADAAREADADAESDADVDADPGEDDEAPPRAGRDLES